ncbi:MAG TPA: TatD family hydrolase [Treponemataceae bacterium]|nr:TatD family hydrolase [Treponemataceae bacterium]HPX27172.1 TatD family hydrolase [Treponemataceae bacterium]
MYCDFHTHLHNDVYLESSLACIKEHGIISAACSVDIPSFKKSLEIASVSDLVIPTFGIHPMKASDIHNLKDMDSYLMQSPIIGEIGLDQRWFMEVPLTQQIKVFEYILDHCNTYKKYCVIHTSGAEQKVYELLQAFPGARPIIHWYDGSLHLLKKMTDKGWFFTYGLELHYSEHIKNLLSQTLVELVLSETDNPGSETWLGGTEESPLLITRVIADIASVKKMSIEQAQNCVNKNSIKILSESGYTRHADRMKESMTNLKEADFPQHR